MFSFFLVAIAVKFMAIAVDVAVFAALMTRGRVEPGGDWELHHAEVTI